MYETSSTIVWYGVATGLVFGQRLCRSHLQSESRVCRQTMPPFILMHFRTTKTRLHCQMIHSYRTIPYHTALTPLHLLP